MLIVRTYSLQHTKFRKAYSNKTKRGYITLNNLLKEFEFCYNLGPKLTFQQKVQLRVRFFDAIS